jgi:recombination protein RecA
LIDNPKVADEIEKKIKTKLGIGVPRAVADLPIDEVAEATSSSVEEVAPVAVSKAADAKVSAAVTKAAASA